MKKYNIEKTSHGGTEAQSTRRKKKYRGNRGIIRLFSSFPFPPCLRASVRTSFEKILLFSIVSLTLSCKTTPAPQDFSLLTSVPLESGASVYILANVKEAAPILEVLPIDELKDKQTKQMMDRTEFFAAGIFPPESGRRFQIAAWGDYPASGAGMALGMNKNWVKHNAKTGQYWYSIEDKLSIALEAKQAFAASWIDTQISPITPMPGIELPGSFIEFRKDASLSFWVENPGPGIKRMLDTREIPIPFQIPAQCLFANLYATGEEGGETLYYSVIRLQFSSSSQAQGIAAIFKMARNLLSDSTMPLVKFFLVNPPVQNGNFLDIKTGLLTENDLSLLLQMFLVNWN